MRKEILSVIILWITAVGFALVWNVYDQKKSKNLLAFQTARAFFDQVVITRSWNAKHGGVYVPVSEYTQPNIYLEDQFRDLTTVQNIILTKINPAFMTRQISEISSETNAGTRFHITSLNPIRPENKASDWEKEWLQSFERGEKEQGAFIVNGQESFFRYMAPLLVKDNCLKCHAKQGYKEGDIRGGVSVTLPHFSQETSSTLATIYGLAMLFGIFFIVVGGRVLNKQRTEALENEEHYRALHNASFGGIIIHDHGTILDCNQGLSNITGFSKAELVGINGLNLIAPASLEEVTRNIKNGYDQRYEVEGVRKDGSIYPLAIIGSNIVYKGRKARVTEFRDISDIKQAEREKDKLATQLRQAQKLEAIGLLAGGVAHDLNNILSGIVGYPELILHSLPKDDKIRKQVEAIQQSGQRASAIVEDLLTLARGAATVKKVHSLNEIIEEYLESPEYLKLEALYPKITCNSNLNAQQADIFCSSIQIKKSVMNLVTNAIEAIAPNGTVEISTKVEKIDKVASMQIKLPIGRYLVLCVKDNGPGITESDIDHIFEPFYSKKVMGKSGTGLGLTVVWNTMEEHDGKVWVESSADGTCFKLFFSEADRHQAEPDSKGTTTENLLGNEEYILIIDDEPQLRDLAANMLDRLGYRVNSVCSGELALEYLKENPVDLVVLDMLMEPGMSGYQTYKEILKLYPDQKAIIASGFSESDDVKAAINIGVSAFITKPYSMKQLGRAVKQSLIN